MESQMYRYIIIDHAGVLETLSDSPSDRDLVLKDIGGIYQIMPNGVDVAKRLLELEQLNCRVAFHSKTCMDDQLALYKSIRNAAKEKKIEFPEVVAMPVRDDIAFSQFASDNPYIKKLSHPEPEILLVGYENELNGKACVRQALQKALNIKDSERHLHCILDDEKSVINAAKKEGWQAFLIDIVEFPLRRAIDQIYYETIKQEEAKVALPTEDLKEFYKRNINPKEWQADIQIDLKKFKFIGEPLPESARFSGSIFRDVDTGKEWLGESDTYQSDKELSEAYACKQRIAADIYGCFGANVVKIELSQQKTRGGVDDDDVEKIKVVHVMSERILKLQTYKAVSKDKIDPINSNGEITLQNGRKVPEQGLGQILAISVFINDIDPLGNKGENIGFVFEETYAKTYKIRFTEAFGEETCNTIPRTIKISVKETILFDNLPPRTRDEFLITVHKIINTDEKTLRGFFSRSGLEIFEKFYDWDQNKLIKRLLERKKKLGKEYEIDLKTLSKFDS